MHGDGDAHVILDSAVIIDYAICDQLINEYNVCLHAGVVFMFLSLSVFFPAFEG